MANYREPQWLLPNEKNLQYPAAGATQGSGLTADRHSLYSMDFGSGDYISTSDVRLGSTYSISLWFNADSFPSTNPVLISQYVNAAAGRFFIGVRDNGGRKITVFSAGHNYGSTTISTGGWNNLILVNDNNNVTLYLNGSVDGNFTFSSAPPDTNILIGALDTTPSNPWDGKIDEVAIFSRALDSSEIDTLYNNGAPSNPMLLSGKPVAYYPLGEQTRKPGTANWRFPNEVLQGQTINFDGTDKIEAVLPFLNNANELTFSGWFNKSSGDVVGFESFVSGTDRAILYWWSDNNVYWSVRNGSSSSAASFALTNYTWNHIAGTFNGSTNTIKLYINGDLVDTQTGQPSSTSVNLSNNFHIGLSNGTTYNNGQISNVAIWDTDQSTNIDNIYNYGAPQTSYTVTPTAWYKLDKTSTFTGLNPNWHSALEFVANESDYIDLGSSPTIFTDFTLSFWYKQRGAAGSFETVVGKDTIDGGILTSIVFTSGLLHFKNRPGSWTALTTTTASNTEFKHYSITYNSSANELKGYCNGNLEVTTTPVFSSATGNEHSFNKIGRYGSIYYLDGQLSNLAAFNQVISPEDIKYLYNGGTPQTNISFEPVSWWKLDNLTTGIQDSGSASNNGTNNGATAVSSFVAVDQWNFDNVARAQTPTYTTAIANANTSTSITTGSVAPASLDYAVFSLWYKSEDPTVWPSSKYLINNNLYSLKVRDNNITVITNHGSIYKSWTCPVHDGNWHNIILHFPNTGSTVNLADITLLFDGVEPSSATAGWGNVGLLTTINGIFGSGAAPYPSQVSNFSFWNTNIVNDANIATIWNNGTPGDISSLNPYLWYKLDNISTGINDSGSGSNNGSLTGTWNNVNTNVLAPRLNGESSTLPSSALTSSDLQFNSAYSSFSLDFDAASGDYIDCTDNDMFSFGNGVTDTPFSISAWIYITGTTAQGIVAKYGSSTSTREWLFYTTGAKTRLLLMNSLGNNNYRTSSLSLSTNTWYHVAATYDGRGGNNAWQGINLYINGDLSNTNSVSTSYDAMSNTSQPVQIGTYQSSQFIDGKVDEVSVFNKELNQAEITSIYNNGYPKDITALAPISWWRLGEDAYFNGNDFIVPNQITGAPNGTSNGMPATALVADAPGSYAAGLGSSLALADRVGDAALSTANSLSFNMIPSNRVSYPAGYAPTQVDNVYSMAFDGASDYIYTPSPSLGITNTWSVSAWVKTADKTSDGGSFRGWFATGGWNTTGDFKLSVRSDNGYASVWEGSLGQVIVGTSNITDDNWYNVVLTKTASDLTLFVNGVQQATVSNSSTWAFNNIYIGAGGQSTGITTAGMWNGNIDELAVFDYALSARQIKQDIYNGTTSGKTADLNNNSNLTPPVAWYRMGD